MISSSLKKLGFTDDETIVYLNLLEKSPTSIRSIAFESSIGRGTVFNILKKFISLGLVSYHRRGKSKIFAVEDPKKLKFVLKRREQELDEQKKEVVEAIPELNSIFSKGSIKPRVKYYEGSKEVSEMLRDVIETMSCAKKKEYYVYSAKGKRQIIYKDFPSFSAERIQAGIKVKVIAIGKGGVLRGLDERKWLSQKEPVDSSYMVIYGDKISFVTLERNSRPVGVIIEDKAGAETQKLIFKRLWKTLD